MVDKSFINSEIANAMRAHDKARLAILRLVKNEIETKEKSEQRDISGEEVVAALKKVLKQTGETLEGSVKAATNDERTSLLRQQVEILNGYLPKPVCGPELEAVVERVLVSSGYTRKRDMGKAIGLVVTETGGNCDKAEVARLMGARLS
jgi:uncharacterized protein YqeY